MFFSVDWVDWVFPMCSELPGPAEPADFLQGFGWSKQQKSKCLGGEIKKPISVGGYEMS